MDLTQHCPSCGKRLAPNAPKGLCPECLMQAGFPTGTAVEPIGTAEANQSGFVPPQPKELAMHFPQLEILRLLGRGGMGAVYQARQKELDRVVALKILPPGIGEDPAFAERFTRVAKALARLNHPGIVTLYEFGRTNGRFYFLMEFVDGVNLRQLLQAGRVAPLEALAIVPQVCDALQYAHDQGIIHRDIKPENILLDRQGRVKVADFGIARLVGGGTEAPASGSGDAASTSVTLTEAGKVMGTPDYMAPEQRDRPAEMDHRADIYALGVVLYQMLTGELPGKPIVPPSQKVQIDVRLDVVVLRALEQKSERRYQQVSEVKTCLEAVAASPPESGNSRNRKERGCVVLDQPQGNAEGPRSAAAPAAGRDDTAALQPVRESSRPATFQSDSRTMPSAAPVGEMRSTTHQTHPPAGNPLRFFTVIRWTARGLGTLSILLVLPFILAEGLPPIASQPVGVQLTFAGGFLVFLGFIIGWWREGTAAWLITSGWTVVRVSESNFGVVTPFELVLAVAALYALCWWATRGRNTVRVIATATALLVWLVLGRMFCPVNVFVSGVVTDTTTGKPITGAELRLLPRPARPPGESDSPNMRSDTNGRFTLYVGWYAPAKQVAIVAPGFLALTTNLGPRALGQRRVNRDFQLQSLVVSPDNAASNAIPVPPVVVRTVPESGVGGVDPALTEIRVTFSKPMQDGSWSWSTWDEQNFPETTGEPCYLADRRTCVLPVRLQPGKVYALWLNSEKFKNFKDAGGEPAVPYLLIFETRK